MLLLLLYSLFKQVRFYESLLAPQGNAIVHSSSPAVSAHIQGKVISIFISMNIFLPFF